MSGQSDKDIVNINQLKERFLECGICKEEYDEISHIPRLLPCLHTICTQCIRQLIQHRHIDCPFCKARHNVNQTRGPESFPKDNTRRDLLEFLGAEDNSSEIKCRACDDKNSAKYRCRNCADFLCEQCYKAHRRTKYTKDHRILRLDELRSVPDLMKEFIFEGFCKVPSHETVPLKLYCSGQECCKPICYNCAVSDHRNPNIHPVKNIAEVYDCKKQSLTETLNGVMSLKQIVQNKREIVDAEIQKIQPSLQNIEKDIDESFGRCMQLLENKKDNLKLKANQIMKRKQEKLFAQKESLNGCIEKLSAGCRFTDETLLYKDVSGFLEIEDTINIRLQKLQEETVSEQPYTNAEMHFQKHKMSADYESFVNQMGMVIATDAYPPNTIITIPDPIQEGREVTMLVQLHNSRQEPITDNALECEVSLTDLNGQCISMGKYRIERKKREYKINVTPPVSGYQRILISAFDGKLHLGSKEIEVLPAAQVPRENRSTILKESNAGCAISDNVSSEQPGDSTVNDKVYDVTMEIENLAYGPYGCYVKIKYKYKGEHVQYDQHIMNKVIVDLLKSANKKGVLFVKNNQNSGSPVSWNKDIPYDSFVSLNQAAHYQKKLKAALATYGIA